MTPAASNHCDPLGYDVPLPLRLSVFPFGYPIEVETNSTLVADAVRAVWGRWTRLFEASPLQLRVAVGGTSPVPGGDIAAPHGWGDLIVTSHGAAGTAVCDLRSGATCAWISQDVAADRDYLVQHFLEPSVCFMAGARRFVILHAACVVLEGKAVLLCGNSGAGKTSVAWGCARAGWAFLSGDATQLDRESAGFTVVGRPHSIRFREHARELFPELRNQVPRRGPRGKLDIEADPEEFGAKIRESAAATHIVLLERCPGLRGSLSPVSPNEMFEYFDQVIFYGPEFVRKAQRETLRHFLKLPLLRLRYPNPGVAEDVLRHEVLCCGR